MKRKWISLFMALFTMSCGGLKGKKEDNQSNDPVVPVPLNGKTEVIAVIKAQTYINPIPIVSLEHGLNAKNCVVHDELPKGLGIIGSECLLYGDVKDNLGRKFAGYRISFDSDNVRYESKLNIIVDVNLDFLEKEFKFNVDQPLDQPLDISTLYKEQKVKRCTTNILFPFTITEDCRLKGNAGIQRLIPEIIKIKIEFENGAVGNYSPSFTVN